MPINFYFSDFLICLYCKFSVLAKISKKVDAHEVCLRYSRRISYNIFKSFDCVYLKAWFFSVLHVTIVLYIYDINFSLIFLCDLINGQKNIWTTITVRFRCHFLTYGTLTTFLNTISLRTNKQWTMLIARSRVLVYELRKYNLKFPWKCSRLTKWVS